MADARPGPFIGQEAAGVPSLPALGAADGDLLVLHHVPERWGARELAGLEPLDLVAPLNVLSQLLAVLLVDGVVHHELQLTGTVGRQLALVDVGDDHAGLVQLVLVAARLSPVAREAARLTDKQDIELARLGVGDHLLELRSLGGIRP
ncbi:MAG: hypothetical protein U0869_07700 [Chloroflexota bacterium]